MKIMREEIKSFICDYFNLHPKDDGTYPDKVNKIFNNLSKYI